MISESGRQGSVQGGAWRRGGEAVNVRTSLAGGFEIATIDDSDY
jgi:hypothetical protein